MPRLCSATPYGLRAHRIGPPVVDHVVRYATSAGERSVNNSLQNTGKQRHRTRATGSKNQQDCQPESVCYRRLARLLRRSLGKGRFESNRGGSPVRPVKSATCRDAFSPRCKSPFVSNLWRTGRTGRFPQRRRCALADCVEAIGCALAFYPSLTDRVETMCSTMYLASRPTPPNNAELSE